MNRRHALVVREQDRFRLQDDRSLNGVFLNGERVVAPHEIRTGDVLTLGAFDMVFVSGEVASSDEGAAERIAAQVLFEGDYDVVR